VIDVDIVLSTDIVLFADALLATEGLVFGQSARQIKRKYKMTLFQIFRFLFRSR
jgi:phage antirepressor YoqD-like protein